MSTTMIERHKLTKATYQALKRYIMLDREKKKQEQEQDKAQERLRKERELRKRKEEEDSLTLEQTKEQLQQLERKLEQLKQEKHGLFSDLKKVLHQENEMRSRAQMREQNEMAALQQQQFAADLQPVPGHSAVFMQGHVPPRSKYMNVHPPVAAQGIKRSRSPSPPPQSSHYPSHYSSQYAAAGYAGALPGTIKQEPYSAPSEYNKIPKTESMAYSNAYGQAPPRHPAYQQPPGQPSSGSGKYAATTAAPQSAFSSYPNLQAGYAYQQQPVAKGPPAPAEQYASYAQRQQQMSRHPTPQSGYMSPHHSAGPSGGGPVPPLQQQLEHASQKAGFVDDKMKSHQQAMISAGLAQQQTPLGSGNPAGQPPARGMVYPIRHPPQQQPGSTMAHGANVGSASIIPPRHGQSRC